MIFLTDPPHPLGTLQSAPKLGDLMNEIATENPEKWKEVAIGLWLVDSDIKNDVPTPATWKFWDVEEPNHQAVHIGHNPKDSTNQARNSVHVPHNFIPFFLHHL